MSLHSLARRRSGSAFAIAALLLPTAPTLLGAFAAVAPGARPGARERGRESGIEGRAVGSVAFGFVAVGSGGRVPGLTLGADGEVGLDGRLGRVPRPGVTGFDVAGALGRTVGTVLGAVDGRTLGVDGGADGRALGVDGGAEGRDGGATAGVVRTGTSADGATGLDAGVTVGATEVGALGRIVGTLRTAGETVRGIDGMLGRALGIIGAERPAGEPMPGPLGKPPPPPRDGDANPPRSATTVGDASPPARSAWASDGLMMKVGPTSAVKRPAAAIGCLRMFTANSSRKARPSAARRAGDRGNV